MEKLQQFADTLKLEMKQCRHQVQKLEVFFFHLKEIVDTLSFIVY